MLGAHDAYEAGLKIDPNNAGMKNDLASVNRAMEQEAGDAGKMAQTGVPTTSLALLTFCKAETLSVASARCSATPT